MGFEQSEDNSLWHYMEKLPRLMSPLLLHRFLSHTSLILYFCLSLSEWTTNQLFLFSSVPNIAPCSPSTAQVETYSSSCFIIKANTVTVANNSPINNSNNSKNKPLCSAWHCLQHSYFAVFFCLSMSDLKMHSQDLLDSSLFKEEMSWEPICRLCRTTLFKLLL